LNLEGTYPQSLSYLASQSFDMFSPEQTLGTISLLQAIRWAVAAWNHDIKNATIFNCFMKSTVKVYEPTYWAEKGIMCSGIPSQIQLTYTDQEVEIEEAESGNRYKNNPNELGEVEDEVEVALEYLRKAEVIQDMMSVTEFLNPMQEEVTDSAEDLEVQV